MRDYTPIIPKKDLVHGAYYIGRCRNATLARWDSEKEVFYHWRTKWNCTYIEKIHCPEDDNVFDVFVAERLAEENEIVEIKLGDEK